LTSDVNNETLKCSDVLDRMQMTRKWEKNGECYQQKLSTHPGTKMDVKNLNEKLDMYLKQFNAREVGICPIKEQLYLQCFSKF
jgi:dynein light intermediate chain